eukprot:CAMPEP_0119014074 /NCGR_PEP_ID=MMETSP1176-20130426/9339_1 /TAXON_ID=265551 /ORGANISM="Synedropsis recta cf, Strain CCMP1620" /LENGTH=313 /DNA_ID=CAMNT_0006967211 /DNA_START=94 /DNA_END=1035 /DNA_ORIENTATION=+
MAARNSCTHITWAEAKGKAGANNNSHGGKKKTAVRQVNHGQALTAKIVVKNSAPAEFNQAELRRARRQDEKTAALARKLANERELEKQHQDVVQPHDQAKERMSEVALELQAEAVKLSAGSDITSSVDLSEMQQIVQCREMQLDEIMALEAIFVDTDEFLVAAESNADELRGKIEDWQADEENEALLTSVVQHPPLSYSLQLSIDGSNEDQMDLVASLLLKVTLPPMYPESALPQFEVAYFVVTDRTAVCSADKPLESLVNLQEDKLLEALLEQAQQIVPDPCVYELAVMWLTDNLFDFCVLHTHGQLQAKKS